MIHDQDSERKALEVGSPIPGLAETMEGQRTFLANLVEFELEGMNGRVSKEMSYKGQEIRASLSYTTLAVFAGGMLLPREVEHEAPISREDFVRHEAPGFRMEIDFLKKTPTDDKGILVGVVSDAGDVFVQSHRRNRSDIDPYWLVDDKKDDYAQADRETGKLLGRLVKLMLDVKTPGLVGIGAEREVIKLARQTQASFLQTSASDSRASKLNGQYLAAELGERLVGVPFVPRVEAAFRLEAGREVRTAFSPALFVRMDPAEVYLPSAELTIVEAFVQGGRRFKKLLLPGSSSAKVIEGRYSPTGEYENTPKQPTQQDYETFVEIMNHPARELIVS